MSKYRLSSPAVWLTSATALFSSTAVAQTPPPGAEASETQTLERFEVTGSRLSGAGAERALSVTPYTFESLSTQGFSNVSDLLRTKLPQFGGGIGTVNDSYGNGGDGSATISLRNLPESRTLLLVNGRRTNADLNMIPQVAIDRIEVLNDGASPIYGSDAVAGVVNVILKKNYDAVDLSARYANTTDTDISERRFGIAVGRTSGPTSIMVAAEYSRANSMFAVDREVSQPTGDMVSGTSNPGLFTPRPTAAETAAATAAGNILVPLRWFVNPAATTGLTSASQIPSGFNPAGFLSLSSSLSAAQRNTLRNEEEVRLNGLLGSSSPVLYGPNAVLGEGLSPGFPYPLYTPSYRPHERQNAVVNLEHVLSPQLTLFAEYRHSVNKSESQLAPSPLSGVVIPASNYWVSTVFPGVDPERLFGNGYRPVELGPRVTYGKFKVENLAVGGFGTLGNSPWSYEVTYMRDKWRQDETQTGGVLAEVYESALASDSATTAFNPFGYTAVGVTESPVNPSSLLESFMGSASGVHTLVIEEYDATVTGPIWQLPAGDIEVAIGAERRIEEQQDEPDEALSTGSVFPFNVEPPFKGSRNITSFYTEVNVPITTTFSVGAAGRWEDYSDAGNTGLKPRINIRWEPLAGQLTIRGSWAQGFVAPSLEDLTLDPSQDFQELYNPVTEVRTQPENGVFLTSNPNLKPAESDSYLFGVVYSPKAVKGLTVGTNYYRIEETSIPYQSAQYIVDQWFLAGVDNPSNPFGPDALPSSVNPAGSQVVMTPNGDLDVIRNVGPINSGDRMTDGIDLFANYDQATGFGTVTYGASWTRVLTFEQEDFPGAGTIDYLGRYWGSGAALDNYGFPKWKGTVSIDWKFNRYSASVGYNYVDGYREVENDDNKVEPFQTFDVRFGYLIPKIETQLSIGANNVLDEQPPFVVTSFESGFDRAIADIRGRMVFVELTRRF